MNLADALRSAIEPDRVREQVPLAQSTTLKAGGTADLVVSAHSVGDVVAVQRLASLHGAPVAVLGAGSNLIVADDGVRGIVLRVDGLAWTDIDGDLATIGAGTMNAHAVRAMHKAGYVGAEFLALVPGQFGGSVAMNAGTRWGELSDVLDAVTIVTAAAEVQRLTLGDLKPAYRHGGVPVGAVVVSGVIRVERGDAATARERVREEKRYRGQTQPYQEPCFGSSFANPPGDAAGRLIEAVGAQGVALGRRGDQREARELHRELERRDRAGSCRIDGVGAQVRSRRNRYRAASGGSCVWV